MALNPYVGSGTTGLILFCAAVWLIVVEYIYFRDNSPIGPLAALGLVIATLMTSIIIVALILIFAFSAPQVG
ncbi:hypothetical protein HED51_05235 [Ochrobactrum grignonense]|nr:hypothetical protein [Brucella grignonensis]